jgi:predicted nucleic acid-binding protein
MTDRNRRHRCQQNNSPFVFDSNVLIPLAVPKGRSASTRLLTRLNAAGHRVVMTRPIVDEVAEKLRTKPSVRTWLKLPDADIEQFISDLPAIVGTEPLPGTVTAHGAVQADPKDDKIIAAAVEANAAYMVPEDPHFVDLGE